MKKIIILLIFLNGCSFTNTGYFNNNVKDLKQVNNTIIFEEDYSMEEYKKLLDEYSKKNDYPNMDK